ncbi:porin family protein [Shewanella sp. AS1]|uniref:porin family protein n=1 Tax=Shewanella sp. AS1 TaxID=2907626 RepID=UPI001F488AA8|nr:porin family protein [Shewanella sp. AS1]MCE9680592.1 porin family protein [Shewanella sp. AS1]
MKVTILAVCLLISPLSQALDRQHALSAGIGWGTAQPQNEKADPGDVQIHYDLAYRYQFTPGWGVELGYMRQDVFLTDIFFSVGNQLKGADSFRTAALYALPLSQSNRLVFKLGANLYDLNFIDTNNKDQKFSQDGLGLFAGLGWRLAFSTGLEMSINYSYQTMDLIDTNTITANLGYRF